jgi:hypothetical protein
MRDPVEVCPLSRGVMLLALNPYLGDYSPAFACSTILYPQSIRFALRLAYPSGRTTGLPCSLRATGWVRSALSAGGGGCPRQGTQQTLVPPQCLLAQARLASLACSVVTAFIERSHMLTIPSTLAPIRLMLAEASSPCGSDAGLATAGYFVSGFLARLVTSPLRRSRVLLAEQQAQSL